VKTFLLEVIVCEFSQQCKSSVYHLLSDLLVEGTICWWWVGFWNCLSEAKSYYNAGFGKFLSGNTKNSIICLGSNLDNKSKNS